MTTTRRIVLLGLMALLSTGCFQLLFALIPPAPAALAAAQGTPPRVSQAAATAAPTTTADAAQSTAVEPTPAPTASTPVTGGIPLQDALPSLAPADVWQNFFDITQVPRPSGHMDQIRAFLVDFGKGLNLDTTVDDAGNVLIRKPASKGMEDHAGVVLQAHMDMVAQKTAAKDFDFLTDPIQAYVAGDWVHADDTTLGADDGIGIAITRMLWGARSGFYQLLTAHGFKRTIQTAFIERVNLTIRRGVATLMRKTWALAQAPEHLLLHTQWWRCYDHFVRPHDSLQLPVPGLASGRILRTPAMAAGLTDQRWSVGMLLKKPLYPALPG